MLISNYLPAAGALLLAVAQTASGNPITLPEFDINMDDNTGYKALARREELGLDLPRRDWYGHVTSRLIEYHKAKRAQFDAETAALEKRDGDKIFRAEGYSSSWGYHSYWTSHPCGSGWNKRWYYGQMIRTITFPNPNSGDRTFWWWSNSTYYHVAHTDGSTGTPCFRYGRPQYDYHNANNIDNQCRDRIYTTNGTNLAGTYYWRSTSNHNSYFLTDPVTSTGRTTAECANNNCKTRRIKDCLLDQVAYEYQGSHPDIEAERVVRYNHPSGGRYYRFYDANNFAWFVACPNGALLKKLKQKRCFPNCPTNSHNPIWDFLPEKLHNPLSDQTPLQDYEDWLDDRGRWNIDRVQLVTYWPPTAQRQIAVDGRACLKFAVSRPGLRHWSVKWFNPATVDKAYPYKENEWAYQEGLWVDLNDEKNDHSKSLNSELKRK